MKIWALHGFLGQTSDWDFLKRAGFDVQAPALLSDLHWAGLSLEEAGSALAQKVRASGEVKPVLVAYSMGARLALQALLQTPDFFAQAFLIAPHLGLETEEARQARLRADESWAQRFETQDWTSLMADWEAQPVFGGRSGPRRKEDLFARQALAASLRNWSLGRQADLAPRLSAIKTPLAWVVGGEDAKFVAQAQRAQGFLPSSRVEIVAGVGHRVPFEAPEALAAFMMRILR